MNNNIKDNNIKDNDTYLIEDTCSIHSVSSDDTININDNDNNFLGLNTSDRTINTFTRMPINASPQDNLGSWIFGLIPCFSMASLIIFCVSVVSKIAKSFFNPASRENLRSTYTPNE